MTHEAQTRELFWQPHAGQTVENVVLMDTLKLRPCKLNPRRDFGDLEALAESIKKDKVIDPLIVRLLPEGPEVICGERRRRAALLANVPMVPVIIRDLNDQQTLELGLIEEIESKSKTDLEKGLLCIDLKTKCKQAYPDDQALAERFGVSRPIVQAWCQAATGIPKEIQKLLPKEKGKSGTATTLGTITLGTALMISRRIKEPERAVALAKAIAEEGVSEHVARDIVKEAARYPGEVIPKIIKRVVDTAPEIRLTPEHAGVVRMGGQSQVCLTKFDPRIKPGAKVDLYAKFAEIKVASIDKKALRDLTEEDAKAEGGYSLAEFRAFWKETHTVWNPKLKVFLVSFEVQKLAKGGKVK